MTRYRPEHKAATRRRLVETAGRRFKSDGIDGSGIATLVADAGLTNGAFYNHFASKDDLVAAVVAAQLADQAAVIQAMPAGPDSVEAYLRQYLSPAHRDDRAGGCPSAALLDEIGRCDEATRAAYTSGIGTMIAAVARHLDDGDVTRAKQRAATLVSLLVGSVQLARAVTNPALSEQILSTAYTHALAIAGVQPGAATLPAAPPTQESS